MIATVHTDKWLRVLLNKSSMKTLLEQEYGLSQASTSPEEMLRSREIVLEGLN